MNFRMNHSRRRTKVATPLSYPKLHCTQQADTSIQPTDACACPALLFSFAFLFSNTCVRFCSLVSTRSAMNTNCLSSHASSAVNSPCSHTAAEAVTYPAAREYHQQRYHLYHRSLVGLLPRTRQVHEHVSMCCSFVNHDSRPLPLVRLWRVSSNIPSILAHSYFVCFVRTSMHLSGAGNWCISGGILCYIHQRFDE